MVRYDGKVFWQMHKSYKGGLWLNPDKFIQYALTSRENQRKQQRKYAKQARAFRRLFGNIEL